MVRSWTNAGDCHVALRRAMTKVGSAVHKRTTVNLKNCHAEALPKHLRTDFIANLQITAEILHFVQNDVVF